MSKIITNSMSKIVTKSDDLVTKKNKKKEKNQKRKTPEALMLDRLQVFINELRRYEELSILWDLSDLGAFVGMAIGSKDFDKDDYDNFKMGLRHGLSIANETERTKKPKPYKKK